MNYDNLVDTINERLDLIVKELKDNKIELEEQVELVTENINKELETVKKYKDAFFEAKSKIDKANDDIVGFEKDYQNLVEKFKDEELSGILRSASKEINNKINERKKKIMSDKIAMNALIDKAESAKARLVKFTAEKKILEIRLEKVTDAFEYYSRAINEIVDYSSKSKDKLMFKEAIINIFTEEEPNVANFDSDDIDVIDIDVDENYFDDIVNKNDDEIINEVLDDKVEDTQDDDSKDDSSVVIITEVSTTPLEEDIGTQLDEVNEIINEYKEPDFFNFDNLESILKFDDTLDEDK